MTRMVLLAWMTIGGGSWASTLVMEFKPLWKGKPMVMNDTSLVNAAENRLSVTRFAGLLSHAELQKQDGGWIGAQDWVGFLDVGSSRMSFKLDGIPEHKYRSLRFDVGLDPTMDSRNPSQWPPQHPLNPTVNGLHWSWRGQFVFLAVEGRYRQADGELGGYSYHLAGQSCRGTVVVPVELDLTDHVTLKLNLHVDRFFDFAHKIDIAKADSTHSAEDDELAVSLAQNAVRGFGVEGVTRGLPVPPLRQETPEEVSLLDGVKVPAHFPRIEHRRDNPLTKLGIALGKDLFHDKRLSINQTQSCASCHDSEYAFSDAHRFSVGAEGHVGARQAMPLFNLAWKPSFFWDGRAPTLREQVLMPIQDPTEMHETLDHVVAKLSDLRPRFVDVFGESGLSVENLAKALEQYLLTLISGSSKMDHTLTGEVQLSEIEQQGFRLFFTESDPGRGIRGADCFHCHGGVHFTNNQFANNGLDVETEMRDAGREKVTRMPADKGKFIVPSLRNVALTAPYMHDGRFKTLDEVIEHYDHGVARSATLDPNLAKHLRYGGLQLTEDEKAALGAFLKTLTDEEFVGAQNRGATK